MASARADQQPLLVSDDHQHDSDSDDDGTNGRDSYQAPALAANARLPSGDFALKDRPGKAGLFVWLLTLAAGLSGLLFGYDTGVISATLVSIGSSLSGRALSAFDMSIITSCTALFALFASPLASVLADTRGRRQVILVADVLFVVGALLQAFAKTVAVMIVGRSIVGAAVGAASFVVPLYIAEAAPAAHRGQLVTVNVLFITLGQVVAYVVGWLLSAHADPRMAWRWMVGLGALPALLQVFLLLGMPESPRWLVKTGQSRKALLVLAKVQPNITTAEREALLETIEAEVRAEAASTHRRHELGQVPDNAGIAAGTVAPTTPWLRRMVPDRMDGDAWVALFTVRRNRRALAIACLLQGLQQLCGFNSLMYFSATIFALVGFNQPTLVSLTVAGTNFVFTVAALLLVDRIGRRRVLLYSIPVMIVGLLLAAYGFSFLGEIGGALAGGGGQDDGADGVAARYTAAKAAAEIAAAAANSKAAVLVLVSIMLYVGSYAFGLGNVPWMQSELFALDVRSLGSGLSTATNWGANFVVGLTFLPMMQALTPVWTFVLYATVTLAGYLLVRVCYPETSGLSLEEAATLLEDDDWGVRR